MALQAGHQGREAGAGPDHPRDDVHAEVGGPQRYRRGAGLAGDHHSLDAGFADRELRAAGFDVIGLRDPLIRRGQTEQWLMVAERGLDAQMTGADAVAPGSPGPDSPAEAGTDAELAAPELRISPAQLKTLLKTGHVLVLDVRDAESYVAGHLPGAVLTPLGDLADRLPELRHENRQIVTYCT